MEDKLLTLDAAVRRFVKPGCQLSIGGFTLNRNPMAAVYEIIRQRLTGLHLYAHSNGQGVDELVGAGCVRRLEIAYGGNGRFAPTCVRFRRAVEQGELAVEDYSNYQMTLRFMAGAMGVPFLPTVSALGTDIINKWGFSAAERRADTQLAPAKLAVVENPFYRRSGDVRQVVLVPAINPDVTIIHAQQASPAGTVRLAGLTFADVEQARAARFLVVTCEELVEEDQLRRQPERNQIPFFNVDAVVHQPYGAYPTACYGYYDYDPEYLRFYRRAAADDQLYQDYLDKHVYGVGSQRELCALAGAERLAAIRATRPQGYAAGLNRR